MRHHHHHTPGKPVLACWRRYACRYCSCRSERRQAFADSSGVILAGSRPSDQGCVYKHLHPQPPGDDVVHSRFMKLLAAFTVGKPASAKPIKTVVAAFPAAGSCLVKLGRHLLSNSGLQGPALRVCWRPGRTGRRTPGSEPWSRPAVTMISMVFMLHLHATWMVSLIEPSVRCCSIPGGPASGPRSWPSHRRRLEGIDRDAL